MYYLTNNHVHLYDGRNKEVNNKQKFQEHDYVVDVVKRHSKVVCQ